MNASLIEARDQEERARSLQINASNVQQLAPKIADASSSKEHLTDRGQTAQTPSHTSDLPGTGSDYFDEPQPWPPRSRRRDH